MTYEAILSLEERNKDNLYKIYFVRENGGWYRAYEWSAYLANKLQDILKIDRKLVIMKKITKKFDKGLIYSGLKLSSFEKYFKQSITAESVSDFGDGSENAYVTFDAENIIMSYMKLEYDNYIEQLDKLKESIKPMNEKDGKFHIGESVSNDGGIRKLFIDILSYPLENKTLVDNVAFITKLKNDVLNII